MKAEYKLQHTGEHVIAEALRFHKMMKLNEKMWKKATRKKDKDVYEGGRIKMKKPMWAIIEVNEGRIISLEDNKKECQEAVRWMEFSDALNSMNNIYIIEREDRI